MYKNVLRKMQQCVQLKRYRTKIHVGIELFNDRLTNNDMRRAIINGGIIRRQADDETGGYQYRIRGMIASGEEMVVVARLELIEQEEWMIIITVWKVR